MKKPRKGTKNRKKNPAPRGFVRPFLDGLESFAPPPDISTSEWAALYRRLSRENAASVGRWQNSLTPHLVEIMDAFSDPRVETIAVKSCVQIGKSETLNNMLGYMIDTDPGPALFVMPTVDVMKDYSARRLSALIRDTAPLREKVHSAKSHDGSNTILRKTYPGGTLSMAGSNSPAPLASIPARCLFADELDRWSRRAGTEGDPWELAGKRTLTFYNRKKVAVSSPTIKGASKIEDLYSEGTMESWQHQCPECGEWNMIRFGDIKFEYDKAMADGHIRYTVTEVNYSCPHCGCYVPESVMRKQPQKWVAADPDALERRATRSFWINGFSSPWLTWKEIVQEFLEAKDDPVLLQVVYNTLFAELWEDRGEIESEDTLMQRREHYGADLPDGVIVLTCGVDTQDDRLEYEVVGHGLYGETWGIERGVIIGMPLQPEVWQQLDEVIDKERYFGDGEKFLKVSVTCVDEGGHFTQTVREQCKIRQRKRVLAIKGKGGDGVPYVPGKPTKVSVTKQNRKIGDCWLYTIGVDAGKAQIMAQLKVQEPGPRFCHFPDNDGLGYDDGYFSGLLSERKEYQRSGGITKTKWVVIPGHERNESLDMRNYAMAAFALLKPDMEKERLKLMGAAGKVTMQTSAAAAALKKKRRPRRPSALDGEW